MLFELSCVCSVARILGLPLTLFWPLAIAAGLTITIVVLFIIVVCCVCFRGRCFSKKVVLGPILIPSVPSFGKYIGQPKYDAWEKPRNILDDFEKQAIGEGCFGEVYQGLLKLQYAKTSRIWRQHHRRLCHKEEIPVAIKRLKREYPALDQRLNSHL